jgi:hypothetical protein
MEAPSRLEIKVPILGREGNFVESSDPSNSYILHEHLLTPQRLMFGD